MKTKNETDRTSGKFSVLFFLFIFVMFITIRLRICYAYGMANTTSMRPNCSQTDSREEEDNDDGKDNREEEDDDDTGLETQQSPVCLI